MKLWLFFTIFGMVLFIPSTLLVWLFNRFRNSILVIFKRNGVIIKHTATDKDLANGKITHVDGAVVVPIEISQKEVVNTKWRRWIIKEDVGISPTKRITDKELESHINNEDLLKLQLAGKMKTVLILLLIGLYLAVGVAAVVNGYMTNSHECIAFDNSSRDFISNAMRMAVTIPNGTGV